MYIMYASIEVLVTKLSNMVQFELGFMLSLHSSLNWYVW